MTERAGSALARQLFQQEGNCLAEWNQALSSYKDAVKIVATAKRQPELEQLDNFVQDELPAIVRARQPPHFTLEELSKITKWKITRGMFRPIQKLVDSNSDMLVVSLTTAAIKIMEIDESDWKDSINKLCELRGVGVATASATLSILYPDTVPFMADEVIESATTCKRDYTMKVYVALQQNCVEKSVELNNLGNNENWNAEMVGKALWTTALHAARNIPFLDLKPVSSRDVSASVPRSTQGWKKRVVDSIEGAKTSKRTKTK